MKKQQNTDAGEIEELELQTRDAIVKGQKEKVMELYGNAEQLFTKGGNSTRSLIANKFILPLAQFLEINYSWGREYLSLLPVRLRAEYRRQVNSSGI